MARFSSRTLVVALVAAVLVVAAVVVAVVAQQSSTVVEPPVPTTTTPVGTSPTPTAPATTPTATEPVTTPGTLQLVNADALVFRGDELVLAGAFESAALRTLVVQEAKPSSTDWVPVAGAQGATDESGEFRVTVTAGRTRDYRVVLPATTGGEPERVTGTVTVRTAAEGWRQVSSTEDHNCGIWSDNTLWCRGRNDEGQLGNGKLTPSVFDHELDVLRPVSNPTWSQVTVQGTDQTWLSVTAGVYHSCAIRTDGTLWCWGSNGMGQLGTSTKKHAPSPTPVQVLVEGTDQTWLAVSAGYFYTCGIRTDHTLWCWGADYGQLGTSAPTDDSSPSPAQVLAEGTDQTWLSVTAASSHTCGIRTDHTLWCWGSNQYGKLGTITTSGPHKTNPTPVQVLASGPDQTWLTVDAGSAHTCGIRTDHTLWCWGTNRYGQLGPGNNLGYTGPNPVPAPVLAKRADRTWLTVSAGNSHTCAIRTNHTLWCWGNNVHGQLGNDTKMKIGRVPANPTPTKVRAKGDDQAWLTVYANALHSCAIRANGTLWCWGGNFFGTLGSGDSPGSTPIKIPDPRL